MLYKGSYYAEVMRSTRFKGTEVLSIHKFDTEDNMEDFILEYNTESLHLEDGRVPDVYTIAQTSSMCTLIHFRNKGLVE